jgi:hypothetical protein
MRLVDEQQAGPQRAGHPSGVIQRWFDALDIEEAEAARKMCADPRWKSVKLRHKFMEYDLDVSESHFIKWRRDNYGPR